MEHQSVTRERTQGGKSPLHSVEISEIYSYAFLAKFRENNGFTKENKKLLKSSFDEKFFDESKFFFFPHFALA